jgi:hypothetical protein
MKRLLLAGYTSVGKKLRPVPAGKAILLFSFFFPSGYLFIKKTFIAIVLLTSLSVYTQPGNAQQSVADYKKAITERSAKIVNTLGITDSSRYDKVLNDIVNQYFQVNSIHEENKTAIAAIKSQGLPREEADKAVKEQEAKKVAKLLQLHSGFLAHLKENLPEEGIEKVKDGMTYRVFPITYAAYQDMLPNLTAEQRDKIYSWLKEARELAMDEGSSEKKHEVFGKYKGKINNFLSAAGYDMKKEGEEWQKRIKERSEKKNPDS